MRIIIDLDETPAGIDDAVTILQTLRDKAGTINASQLGTQPGISPSGRSPVETHLELQNRNVGAQNAKLTQKVAELESKIKASDDTSLELEQCKTKLAEVQSELNDEIVKASARDNEVGGLQSSLQYEREKRQELEANITGLERELEQARADSVSDDNPDDNTYVKLLKAENAHDMRESAETIAKMTDKVRNVKADLQAMTNRANQFEAKYKEKSDELRDTNLELERMRAELQFETLLDKPLDIRYDPDSNEYYLPIGDDRVVLNPPPTENLHLIPHDGAESDTDDDMRVHMEAQDFVRYDVRSQSYFIVIKDSAFVLCSRTDDTVLNTLNITAGHLQSETTPPIELELAATDVVEYDEKLQNHYIVIEGEKYRLVWQERAEPIINEPV